MLESDIKDRFKWIGGERSLINDAIDLLTLDNFSVFAGMKGTNHCLETAFTNMSASKMNVQIWVQARIWVTEFGHQPLAPSSNCLSLILCDVRCRATIFPWLNVQHIAWSSNRRGINRINATHQWCVQPFYYCWMSSVSDKS